MNEPEAVHTKESSTSNTIPERNVSSGLVVTMTGKKYHVASCRTVKQVKRSITSQQAEEIGYTACKVCNP